MSSLALYRTYRPGRFADVVGQDHVTGPLTRALENDRVHHAYLFSGPRGCGKTSSARILARSLNCEKGPTSQPCGECRSCVDLAPNGPGSIDVIELDAATHGLVDDARDLREKAHFAPMSSRFKIYIIDEAHQLGPGAANALLKLIEEPPAHVKFIFATTAPDKIIGTIRSRTHHYPFRLIPARTLQTNLAGICEREGIAIEPAALALVARAGAGSARDAQSILGQLIAGSGEEGVTYDLAIALLGFTDATLLDEVVDAIATGDDAIAFRALDRVIDSGHDPRRFLTDLLERFRDLVVLRAVPDAASTGLIEAAEEEAIRLAQQANRFGGADLVRLADVVDEGITAMKGATPTRLQLELVCARLLLPGADDSARGVAARLDRLERRLDIPEHSEQASVGPAPTPAPTPAPASGADAPSEAGDVPSGAGTSPPSRLSDAPTAVPERVTTPPPAPTDVGPAATDAPGEVAHAPPDAAPRRPSGAAGVADVRRLWPEVLVRRHEIKRTPWSLISQESSVVDVADGVLTLAFKQPTLRDTFARREDFQTYLRQAISDVLGLDLRVEAIVDPAAETGAGRPQQLPTQPPVARPADSRIPRSSPGTGDSADHRPDRDTGAQDPDGRSSADPNDRDLDDAGVSQRELLERALGARVIHEIEHP